MGKSAFCLSSIVLFLTAQAPTSERLYNGIHLLSPWPPRIQSLTSEPVMPSYLSEPPDVIPIDVGRQLFVDDFLIEETTLQRTYHKAEYYSNNPILKPDRSWEQSGRVSAAVYGPRSPHDCRAGRQTVHHGTRLRREVDRCVPPQGSHRAIWQQLC